MGQVLEKLFEKGNEISKSDDGEFFSKMMVELNNLDSEMYMQLCLEEKEIILLAIYNKVKENANGNEFLDLARAGLGL